MWLQNSLNLFPTRMIKKNKIDNEPLVSVIMNCYNGEKYLREAIDSVYSQTYKDWEIIFWDNASTDRSAEIAKSYNSKLKYFRGEKTIPLGAARNKAMEECNGKYIAFLDVDDIWMSEKLERQIPLFNDLKVGIVFSLYVKSTDKGIVNKNTELGGNDVSFFQMGGLLSLNGLPLSSTIVSKKGLGSLNHMFDELLQHAEEHDLFLRLGYYYNAVRINKPLFIYRIHPDMNSLKDFNRNIIESEYVFSKIKLLHPDIEDKYSTELESVEMQNAWGQFLRCILKKERRKARKYLFPYIGLNIKYFSCFFLSFFSSKLIKTLWVHSNSKKGNLDHLSL